MPGRLHSAVQTLATNNITTEEGHQVRLSLSDGTVTIVLQASGAARRIQVVYVDESSYPASGAILMCENEPDLEEELSALNETFMDRAPLPRVVAKVRRKHAAGGTWKCCTDIFVVQAA
jgi:hypothetical protein